MKQSVQSDNRLSEIIQLLNRFLSGDFSKIKNAPHDPELEEIFRLINELGIKAQRSVQVQADYEKRVTALMDVLLKYTLFDFSEKAEISPRGDEIDAIALALNTLGEELDDRIQSQKKQFEELEKFAAVIENTADAVISIDPKLRVTHWNKSATRIYGYALDEIKGKNLLETIAVGNNKKELQELISKSLNGQQVVNVLSKAKRKDGAEIDIAITITAVKGATGHVTSTSIISRDVTEQRKAENILRQSEEKFRSLVEGVKDYAIVMLDPDGNVISWNEGAEAIKGYKSEEVMNKNFDIFYTDEDRQNMVPEALLDQARRYGKASSEGFRVRKDGSYFWGYVVLTCLRDEKNKIIGFSKIIRDLTESKEKDDEIRKYTLRLEQKNIELERTNKELASFAYVSSHDLQEPLRKIQTFASRILETDFKCLSEQGRDYFNRMNASANRMQQLILDILDYSKLTTHNIKPEFCDLNKLVDEVLEEFKDTIHEKKATVHVANLCSTLVIPFQFKQLISNLLSNALKFASILRDPLITLSSRVVEGSELPAKIAYPKNQYCHVTFTDNGIGFEPHFSDQIFEVFQRLHNQEVYKGTGIGLAICKKIVDNHNGVIRATGELDKGARFDIYLPMPVNG